MNTTDKEKFWKDCLEIVKFLRSELTEEEQIELAEEVVAKRFGPKPSNEGANDEHDR